MKKVVFSTFLLLILFGGYFMHSNGYIYFGQEHEEVGLMISDSEMRVSPYGVEEKLLDRLVSTKYELSIWLYRLTRKPSEKLLKNLSKLGLNIVWIGENMPYEGLDRNFLKTKNRMQAAGINVLDDEQMGLTYNHAKTIIADDDRFLISTGNFTYSSVWKNREYRFVGRSKRIVESLKIIFKKDVAGDKIDKVDIIDGLLICPVNCRQAIMDKILSSTSSIYISAQYLQDEIIRDLLLQRSNEVKVKILLGFWQDEGRLDEFSDGVVKILADPYLHTKNILIDEESLIHGSMNLSQNSLDNNREIGIIIEIPKVIGIFKRQFEKDWGNGIPYHDWNFTKK